MQRGDPQPGRIGKVTLDKSLTHKPRLTPENAALAGLSAATALTLGVASAPKAAEAGHQLTAITSPAPDFVGKAAGSISQPVVDAVRTSASAAKDYFTLPEFKQKSERESLFGTTVEARIENGKVVPIAPDRYPLRNIPPKVATFKGHLNPPEGIADNVSGEKKDITIRVGSPSESAPQLSVADTKLAAENGRYVKAVLGDIQKPEDISGTLLAKSKDPSADPHKYNEWLMFVISDTTEPQPADPRTGLATPKAPDGSQERFYVAPRQFTAEEKVPPTPIPLS